MQDFATLLATLLLIVPGFAATAVFGLVIGNRIHEFSAAAIWSLLFTTVTYALLYAAHARLAWIAPNVAALAALDQNAASLTVILAARLGLWGIGAGSVLAYALGLLVRARPFRAVLRALTGRGNYPDAWNEVFADVRARGHDANVLITLKDGSAYLGLLDATSELPAQRGIILRNVVEYDKDDRTREAGRPFADRDARVLITGEIAAVYAFSREYVERAADEADAPAPPEQQG